MNLPSNTLHLEIATVSGGFLVKYDHDFAGSVAQHGVIFLKNREELQAWLANAEIVVQ